MNDRARISSSGNLRPLLRKTVIGALVLLLVSIAGYGVREWDSRKAGDGDYIFASVQRGDIEDLVTATGTLQPRDYVDVGAQVSGQVETIQVEVGAQVQQGQLLMEIDATQSIARVDANRANLRAQDSQLVDRENTRVKAERDFLRQQALMQEEGTTLEQLQDAETAFIAARQAIVTLRAQIEQQKASMRVEEQNLRFTKIVAPISGTVVSITAKRGQTLNATQQAPTLLRIADLNTMTVQTQVSEADVSKLRDGMPAYFTTLGNQQRRWYGSLKRIEPTPTVTNNVVLYNALFDVQNQNNALLPQMTAQVFFVRAEARKVLMMPMAALQQGQQLASKAAAGAERKPDADPAARGNGAGPARNEADREPGRQRGPGGEGQRAGGMNGGQPPTAEQREEFRRRREERQTQRQGGQGDAAQRPSQQRRGVVMVKQADGELAPREVVIGVTNRVHGEVLSGVAEGEEVVAGLRQAEAAKAPANSNQGQNQNRFGQGMPPGGPGGPRS